MRRARPVLVLAAVAFAAGAIVGARHSAPPGYALADQFVTAWTRRDYASMYSDIAASSRRSTSVSEFASDYREALTTATVTRVKVLGRARAARGGGVTVPVRVDTRLFGALSLAFTVPIDESPGGPSIVWSRSLTFPGLRPGERLNRSTSLPRRAPLLARDGSLLAEAAPGAVAGAPAEATRNSPLGAVADAVLGTVGPVPSARRQALEEQGVPAQAIVGLSGLELALDGRLRGTAGGELLAGARPLAYAKPHTAPPVRTTVSPVLQRAAVSALGGQLGGIVAMQPSTGQILAVAGLGLDGLQPPGSTFKMITTTGVLAAKIATEHTVFPYATFATLDGVKLNNANGEECGGSLELAFAVSCNSVFSPLGVKLGAGRLVATAERFGFNHEPGIAGAAESTLPPAARSRGNSTSARPRSGRARCWPARWRWRRSPRPSPTAGADPSRRSCRVRPQQGAHVMSASVARTMRHLMIGVVREGTGTAAAIPGVTVAGKTGTAELKTACTTVPARKRAPAKPRKRARKAARAAAPKAKPPTPTRGSPRSRRRCTRGSSCACCSSKTAPAAPPPRRSPAKCSKPGYRPNTDRPGRAR